MGQSQTAQAIALSDPAETMRQYKETGNIVLRNALVMHYLKYINAAICSMRSVLLSHIPYEDFFNQGVITLIDCIERFDPTRGASFDTYSYLGIRGAILKYLRKQNWLPNRLWDLRKKVAQTRSELQFSLQRDPTMAELAEKLNISQTQLSSSLAEISVIDTLSFEELLETTYYSGISACMCTHDSDPEPIRSLVHDEMSKALADAIDGLPPRQKQVISLYYYEKLNLQEIGSVLDVSPQRVSQIRKSALEKLSTNLRSLGYTYDD